MKSPAPLRSVFTITCGLAAVALAVGPSVGQDQLPPTPPPGQQKQFRTAQEGDFEVQTRGPIHEAFAEEYSNDPEPGSVISQEPPEPIDELPPEEMPEGENVEWIPGYWYWDDDLDDFLWVSGVWRDIPPNQRWVPGYWTEVDAGYQWISGFWTEAEIQQVSYQPYPPESLEYGPTTPAPGDQHFWIPGCWIYADNDYRWRPGYWNRGYDDWLWVPARYVWTPHGAVFAPGYWDYRLSRRGVLFSPVYFRNRGYYRYTPNVVVNVGSILVHLFVRPGHRHYYYGDYYGNRYANRGFYPWYSFYSGPRYYDPLLTYYTFRYGHDDFLNRVGGWHNFYRDNEQYRPPRTFAGQREFAARFGQDADVPVRQALLTSPLNDFVQNARKDEGGLRFRQLSDDNRRELVSGSQQSFGELRNLRRDLESRIRSQPDADQRAQADQAERRGQIRETLKLPALDPDRLRRRTPQDQPANQGEAEPERNRQRPQIPQVEREPGDLIQRDQLPDRLRDIQNRIRNERPQQRGSRRPDDAGSQQRSLQDRLRRNLPDRNARPDRNQRQQPQPQQNRQQLRERINNLPKVNRSQPQDDAQRMQQRRSFDRLIPNSPRRRSSGGGADSGTGRGQVSPERRGGNLQDALKRGRRSNDNDN